MLPVWQVRRAILGVRDALGRQRVVAQESRKAAVVADARVALEFVEELGHALRIETGRDEALKSDTVGFTLEVPRIRELGLHVRALHRGRGTDRQVGA
jgi:hypothetical protein